MQSLNLPNMVNIKDSSVAYDSNQPSWRRIEEMDLQSKEAKQGENKLNVFFKKKPF